MALFHTLRARLGRAHPDHHAIARGMAWVALFAFVGKLAGAAREMTIAWRYGVSAEVDAYLFLFNTLSWPVGVWFSALGVVLVPLGARLRQGAPAEVPRFRAELLGLALLLGAALVGLIWVGLGFLLAEGRTGLPPGTVVVAASIGPTLALLAPLGLVIGLFSAWMLAAGRHANTLLEAVPALGMLVVLLAWAGGGAEALVWGTLGGFAGHLACLGLLLARRGELEAPRFTRRSPHWPDFWKGFGIMVTGQALMSFTGVVDQLFAAGLGHGAVASLSYSNKLMALINGMGTMAVQRATLPVFSRAQAEGPARAAQVARRWVQLLFGLGLVGSALAWWLAPLGVRLLFERGAFTAQDTVVVAEVLRYGVFQLPFYFAGIVLVSLLASQGRHKVIAATGFVNLFVKAGAVAVLAPRLGVRGVSLATTVMYAGTLLMLSLALRKGK